MLFSPEDHPHNPPSTWRVVKRTDRLWSVVTKDGDTLTSQPRKKDAEMILTMGFWVDFYNREGIWYTTGRDPKGQWKPYVPKTNTYQIERSDGTVVTVTVPND